MSLLVFTDEGRELSESAALVAALRHSVSNGLVLAKEPKLSISLVTTFCGEGDEEDIPEGLAALDPWAVEYAFTRQPVKLW
ncbi:hypothetical protein [Streptomyces sp. NPDC005780]|uniref:hypothetical protein n=1 Tax=Streptomyces sp. NPDC005780 TaxID=3364730 RepID=UPI003677123C